ncbi:MAG: hypothetical protein GXY76_10150 [Chloroflexi bacterium]|nr:hypothetical protein [Chloroflexota bacterium]
MSEYRVKQRRRPDLVTLIAIYHLLVAALWLLGVLAVGFGLVVALLEATGTDAIIAPLVLGLVMLVFLAFCAVNVATSLGLFALKNWARWLALVLGILALPKLPIGTVVGAIEIWYLLTPEAQEAFGAE